MADRNSRLSRLDEVFRKALAAHFRTLQIRLDRHAAAWPEANTWDGIVTVVNCENVLSCGKVMEDTVVEHCVIGHEEEYVMLNLDGVVDKVNITANAPYVLSGLDTLNLLLIIDNRLKLVGEYDETIGTCYVFAEQDAARVVHEETGPSERNLFSGACIIDSNQPTTKQVRPISSLHKMIRFRLFYDSEVVPDTAV